MVIIQIFQNLRHKFKEFGNQIFTNNLPSFSDRTETNALWISLRWDWNKKKDIQNTETLPPWETENLALGVHTACEVSQSEAVTNPAVPHLWRWPSYLKAVPLRGSPFTQSKPPRPHHLLWLYTFRLRVILQFLCIRYQPSFRHV